MIKKFPVINLSEKAISNPKLIYYISNKQEDYAINLDQFQCALDYLISHGKEFQREIKEHPPILKRIKKSRPLMNVQATYQKSKIILPGKNLGIVEVNALKNINQWSNTTYSYYYGPFFEEEELLSFYPYKGGIEIISETTKGLEKIAKDLNLPLF